MTQHSDYIGKHHHHTTALAAIAGNGGPLHLLKEAHLDEHAVALGIDLAGPTPHLRLVSDHDMLTIELTPTHLEHILTEAARIAARPQVELRAVDPSASVRSVVNGCAS